MDATGLTVEELIAKLRADARRERKREGQARRAAERAETAMEAIQAVTGFILTGVDDDEEPPHDLDPLTKIDQGTVSAIFGDPPFGKNGEKPLGEAAVLRVVSEDPGLVWTPREIHRILEARGWLNPRAAEPRAGTEAAIGRLVKKGKLAKLARGEYAYLGGDRHE
jgi:hypothetical protein